MCWAERKCYPKPGPPEFSAQMAMKLYQRPLPDGQGTVSDGNMVELGPVTWDPCRLHTVQVRVGLEGGWTWPWAEKVRGGKWKQTGSSPHCGTQRPEDSEDSQMLSVFLSFCNPIKCHS